MSRLHWLAMLICCGIIGPLAVTAWKLASTSDPDDHVLAVTAGAVAAVLAIAAIVIVVDGVRGAR